MWAVAPRREAAVVSLYTHTGWGHAAMEQGPGCTRAPSRVPWGLVSSRQQEVLPAHRSRELGRLHHSIQGAAAGAHTSGRCLCSCGAPALGRVRGHEQGTAAVCRVFQVCQGGPRRGQRPFQALRQCTFTATIPWGWWGSLCGIKGIVICRIVEHTVRVDGGLIGWWRVIGLVDIWILVSCVGRRRVVEVESPTFPIIRKMQWGEACAEPVWAVVKARDPPAKVEVVQVCSNQGLDALPAPLAQPVDHEKQQ